MISELLEWNYHALSLVIVAVETCTMLKLHYDMPRKEQLYFPC